MASIQERLQIKREPLDKWSTREQLCLAVARMNDQNLTSVSRALKPFGESNRPSDWFHQKNCAAQYGALLANVETPKRKKRTSGVDVVETPAESILRKLLEERKAELKKLLAEEKAEYASLQEDMALLQSGKVTEEQLDVWCKEIDEEEAKKEQETIAHAQWLKERELRKQEIERQWRPLKPTVTPIIGQKRKTSESLDLLDTSQAENEDSQQETQKPALSPLLTSLLKSPSQVQQNVTSSILHSAITRTTTANPSPTIASLLNSSTSITVSPGIQQLVSSAIGPETATTVPATTNDILDDQNLSNIKIDDLANSILVQDDDAPLPEIKNDVDGLISDLIENAQDIVEDPEQHLQLDGNGDLNLELVDLEENEESNEKPAEPVQVPDEKKEESEKEKAGEKVEEKSVDPFEFQEEPEFSEPIIKLEKQQEEDTKLKATEVKEDENEEEKQNIDVVLNDSKEKTTEFTDELYDDLSMEIKVDKSGKAKRDYSRTKKKDDKDDKEYDSSFMSITSKTDESIEDNLSDFTEKEVKSKIKVENDRSSSPWAADDDLKTKRRLSTPQTPPVTDSVPSSPASSGITVYFDDDREYKNWKKSVMLVYNRLAANKYASLFLKPITNDQAPGYHNVVYRPIDLSTIRKNIENGTIRTTQEFQRDVMLMLNNAIMFNKTNDTVFNMARQMQLESMQQIQILLQAQSQIDTPSRRETRTSEPGTKRKRGVEDSVRSAKKRKED